jgi:hypothetical protein
MPVKITSDTPMTVAAIDRIIHHATIIKIEGAIINKNSA